MHKPLFHAIAYDRNTLSTRGADRIVGSHHVMVFPGDATRTVTGAVHPGRDLKPGTLRSIIRQAGFSVEEFSSSGARRLPIAAKTRGETLCRGPGLMIGRNP